MAAKEGPGVILGLYRQILRAHRSQLPTPMRVLGDAYAREEFRQHLHGKTTHEQWITFGSEWSKYLSGIGSVPGEAALFSGDLSDETINSMTKEQRGKLEELRQEAIGNSEVPKGEGEDK